MDREQEILAELAQARADFKAAQADLQQHLDQMKARPLLSDEERKALEEMADKGELDDDMAAVVTKVRNGEDTWDAVFAGESANGALLQGALSRIVAEHADDIEWAWQDLLDEEEEKGNYL